MITASVFTGASLYENAGLAAAVQRKQRAVDPTDSITVRERQAGVKKKRTGPSKTFRVKRMKR